MLTLAIPFDHFQFAFIQALNVPGSYALLLFTASDLTAITSHIHNWVLFLLWFCPFILSGVISTLISGSILDTYRPGEFTFQCPIFLPLHTVHGDLKSRLLKWFAIPFSSGPHFVRWPTLKSDWLYSLQPKMEKHYTVIKYKTGRWLWLRSWSPYYQIKLKKVGKTTRPFW